MAADSGRVSVGLFNARDPEQLHCALGIIMTTDLQPLSADKREAVKRDCEALARFASQVLRRQIGYDEASIKWLSSLIEFSRSKPNEVVRNSLLTQIGCFLGETLIRRYGGEWVITDGGVLGVRLRSQAIAFPFEKVLKQFQNGTTDSIWGFFKMAEVLVAKDSQLGSAPNGSPAASLHDPGDSEEPPSVI